MNERCDYCGDNIGHGNGYKVISTNTKEKVVFLHKRCGQYYMRQEARIDRVKELQAREGVDEQTNLGDC